MVCCCRVVVIRLLHLSYVLELTKIELLALIESIDPWLNLVQVLLLRSFLLRQRKSLLFVAWIGNCLIFYIRPVLNRVLMHLLTVLFLYLRNIILRWFPCHLRFINFLQLADVSYLQRRHEPLQFPIQVLLLLVHRVVLAVL